jgi:hypothetical protein
MKKQTKSQRVEKYLTLHPDEKATEVAKRLKVSVPQVYVIRRKLNLVTASPEEPNQQKANSHQEGGDHYKNMAIQPWDFIITNKLGFLEGNIVKYVCRWQSKGGLEDLRKANHYLTKLIEVSNGS